MIRRKRPLKVLITDHQFPHVEIERSLLAAEGVALEVAEGDWRAAAADADALLVQYARLDRAALADLTRCRLIVRYGIGVDSIDLTAATAQGIAVSNVPDYGLDEVADHAMALLLAGFRRLPALQALVGAGRWGVPAERPLIPLSGSTLGVAGFGAIGRRVTKRALAFGMRVLAYDPFVPRDLVLELGAKPVTLAKMLGESDAFSLHLPLNPKTAGLFDAAAFAAMRPGAVLVNTSRGGVIDEGALLAALDRGTPAFAGLDVLAQEPPAADHPLLAHPRALITGHTSWYSEASIERLQRHAAEEVARFLREEPLRYVLNR